MKYTLLTIFLVAGAVAFSSTEETEFFIGATTHYTVQRGIPEESLPLLKEAGMNSIRQETVWNAIEQQPGVFKPEPSFDRYANLATKLNLKTLLLLAYSNKLIKYRYPETPEDIQRFVKYAEFTAKHNRGNYSFLQVWNEWEYGTGMPPDANGAKVKGNAEGYVRLLSAVYPALKNISPETPVLASPCGGRTFDFIEELFKNGVLKYCDGYSYHPYSFFLQSEKRLPEAVIERMHALDQMARKYNNGKSKPIYLSEIGWPTHIGSGKSTEAQAGDYLARLYLLAKTIPAIKGIWYYNAQEKGYDEKYSEHHFGILTPDLTPKDGYYVMKSIAPLVKKGKFIRELPSGKSFIRLLLFQMPDQTHTLAAWTTQENSRVRLVFSAADKIPQKVILEKTGFAPVERPWGFYDWAPFERTVRLRKNPVKKNEFSFETTTRPMLVHGFPVNASLQEIRSFKTDLPNDEKIITPIPETILGIPRKSMKAPEPTRMLPRVYRKLMNLPYKGEKDLSAEFTLSYYSSNLYFNIVVEDDIHSSASSNFWNGDSVQFAFAALNPEKKFPEYCTEYAMALTPEGPRIERTLSQFNLKDQTTAQIQVERIGSKTFYSVIFSLRELGIQSPVPGKPHAVSILVNDNDGKGRKGYLFWSDGLAIHKDIRKFNWIYWK